MTMNGTTSKWIRLSLAAAMASAMGIAISSSGSQAALPYDTDGDATTLEELTRFQIDGDREPGVSSNTGVTLAPGVDFDWTSEPYGPQPIGIDATDLAPAGIGSSGLLPLVFSEIKADDFPTVSPSPNPAFGLPGEAAFCIPDKEDAWVGGLKVNDVNIDDPLYKVSGNRATDTGRALDCSNVLGKGDLFSTYAAYETVAIPNVYGDPDSGSQTHTIVYGAWERGEVPGELNFYIPLVDSTFGNSAGDRLIAFDYDSSNPAAYRILSWNDVDDEWVIDSSGTVNDSSTIFAASVGYADGTAFDPGQGGGGGNPSFGEFALDITAAGILPQDSSGGCVELSTGGFVFTETGNSGGAQLKDYVGAPKIPIGNCGPLQVTKAGPDGVTDGPVFDYRVEQLDSETIFDVVPDTVPASTETQINSQFQIGDTQVWENVFAEPDYIAFESPVTVGGSSPAVLPPGWEMVLITCTYIDEFTPGFPTITDQVLWTKDGGRTTDSNGDLTVFQVQSNAFLSLIGQPDFIPGCTITNDAAGIIIEKAGVGDPAQVFDFTAGAEAFDLTLGDSTFIALPSGTDVTITEADVAATPGWALDSIECTNEDGSPHTTGNTVDRAVTITSDDSSNTITCVFTNIQNGTITIDKAGNPADSPQMFDFTVDADPAGSISIADAPIVVEVSPGSHTVAEAAVIAVPVWVLTDITCDNEANEDVAAQSVDVSVAAGSNVNCTFTNNQRGPVTVVKTATLVDPAPVAGTIDQFDVRYTVTATSASNIPEEITVTDDFAFPSTITVVSGPVVTGAASTPGWNGDDSTNLYTGIIAANGELTWTIDVRVALDLDAPMSDRDCNAAGSGAWNDVTLAVTDGATVEDDACVGFGDPDITIDKNVVGPATVNLDGSISVGYTIDVANTGEGPGAYALADGFDFPAWVTVVPGSIVVTGPGGVALDATFDGDANQAITDGSVGLGPDVTHSYTISLDVTAAPTSTATGADCVGGQGGNGLFNLATITVSGTPTSDNACADIPRGQITVTKATIGGTGTFDFSSDVAGDLINGGSITTTTDDGTGSGNSLTAFVTPGAYTVTEAAQAGWTQLANPCGEGDPAVVTDGGSVSCDFENGLQGSIRVEKIADPAGTFEFALAPGDTQSVDSGNGYTWGNLDAGDFTLTETIPDGWQLLGATCDAAGFDNGGTISLDWGENVVCEFTNEAFSRIIVEKQTVPDGALQTFDFTTSYDDLNVTLADGQTDDSGLIAAGDYLVTELVTDNWELTDLTCSVTDSIAEGGNGSTGTQISNSAMITLEPGDTLTCVFTNNLRGQVTIDKVAVPDSVSRAGNVYTVVYELTVGTESTLDEDFTLSDTPGFAPGVDIINAVYTDESDAVVALPLNGSIAPGTTQVYTATITFTIAGGVSLELRDCAGVGTATFNSATVVFGDGLSNEANDCVDLPDPQLTVVKTVANGQPVESGGGAFTATYTVTVDNIGEGPGAYTAVDTPDFGDGATVTNIAVTGNGVNVNVAGAGPATIIVDETIDPDEAPHVYTVVVTFTTALTMTPIARTCDAEQQPGFGAFNGVAVTYNGNQSVNDDDCVDIPDYDVGITKTASGIPGATVSNGEQFNYVLTVTNNGSGTATNVVVSDQVPGRLSVVSVSVPAGWTDATSGNTVGASVPSMAPGATAVITVRVELLAAPTGVTQNILDGDTAPAIVSPPISSLLNEACVDAARDDDPTNDCDDVEVPVDDIVGVVYTICRDDARLLGYRVQVTEGLADQAITLTWTPDAGAAGTSPAQVAREVSAGDPGQIEWPGNGFTSSGVIIDYPGFRPLVASDYNADGTLPAAAVVLNGQILDGAEPDFAWSNGTTVVFSVNPEIEFSAAYPAAVPGCEVDRTANLTIDKASNVTDVTPGSSFEYSLSVANVSQIGAASPVSISDAIPADIKVDSIVTNAAGFPRWVGCEVTGKSANGFGGTLRCDLFGPLMMGQTAPLITLGVTVSSATTATSIVNTGVVSWALFDDPEQTGQSSDSVTVTVTRVDINPPPVSTIPKTGSDITVSMVRAALVFIALGGIVVIATRRRREGDLESLR